MIEKFFIFESLFNKKMIRIFRVSMGMDLGIGHQFWTEILLRFLFVNLENTSETWKRISKRDIYWTEDHGIHLWIRWKSQPGSYKKFYFDESMFLPSEKLWFWANYDIYSFKVYLTSNSMLCKQLHSVFALIYKKTRLSLSN